MRKTFLTTEDNPYNPSEDFGKWYSYDVSHGYNTCQLLARIAKTSNGFSEKENNLLIENAIDDIIAIHSGIFYKKVVTES